MIFKDGVYRIRTVEELSEHFPVSKTPGVVLTPYLTYVHTEYAGTFQYLTWNDPFFESVGLVWSPIFLDFGLPIKDIAKAWVTMLLLSNPDLKNNVETRWLH